MIIRLCDISSDATRPLVDPANADFASTISRWFTLTDRIFVWNYVADFAAPVQPFPNYYSIGPDIQFLAAHGVSGVFEEGPGLGPGDGTDLEELKDYVMASMLWDPTLNPEVLISEFLNGYYGIAAPYIREHMDVLHAAVASTRRNATDPLASGASCCTAPWDGGIFKSFLTPSALLASATAFVDAVRAVEAENVTGVAATLKARVERASLGVRWVILWRWDELRQFSREQKVLWPLPDVSLSGTFVLT